MSAIIIESIDPTGAEAIAWSAALWGEIQRRYDFVAPDPYDAASFTTPGSAFWVARIEGSGAGSIALARSAGSTTAELDVLYVAPDHRRRGVASALLTTLLDHAQRTGVHLIRLRAGSPQPEALAFYRDAGFVPTRALRPLGRGSDGGLLRARAAGDGPVVIRRGATRLPGPVGSWPSAPASR